jgi:hypothetical protein
MHVPTIPVVVKLDLVFSLLLTVMITIIVPKILAVQLMDVPTLKLFARITMLVLKILVISQRDVFSLIFLLLVKQITSAIKTIVAQLLVVLMI